MTTAGCESELHDQEDWLVGFLLSDPELTIDEPRIVLSSEGVVITLLAREVAQPDLELVDDAVFEIDAHRDLTRASG